MNQVHDYGFGPTATLLDPSSWMTVDPGSMATTEAPRALQDNYYKLRAGDSGERLSEWHTEDPS